MDNYVTRKIHLEFEADHEFPKDWDDDNIERYLAEIGIFGGGITMDVRGKLVELFYDNNVICDQKIEGLADDVMDIISNVVTVQEWISVDDRLPEYSNDGFADAVLVTDGFVQHMAYFVGGEWRFAESGEIKEPMWYRITHWMPLPEPPKGE